MSLFNLARVPRAKPLSELNTGSPIFINTEEMGGNTRSTFHVNMIYLLERLFKDDYYTTMSIEQERFMERFFEEAGKYTDGRIKYEDLPEVFKQFDRFLGNYDGVNDDEFAR